MKTDATFEINMQAYTVKRLSLEDIKAVQALCGKCLDYMLLVDGHPADPNEVEREFQEVPPGNLPEDKYVFGIVNIQDELVGLLDGVRSYPEPKVWWIGLLLLLPEVRSQGMGRKVLESFAEFVQANGGQAIMLGVVEENTRAWQFWGRAGFELVRVTEPRQFGNKTQTVRIMRRNLPEAV
jgi:ribosomal protein S18 acetylase RimI-like enzyme